MTKKHVNFERIGNNEREVRVGTNICVTCNKVIYTPDKDEIRLIDDLKIVKCPVCNTNKRIMVITKIVSKFDLLN